MDNLMEQFKWFIPPVNNVDYIHNKWKWKRKNKWFYKYFSDE